MAEIHFLNVLEGDCNIIKHDSGRVSVIDVSNAYDEEDTPEETATKNSETRKLMRLRTGVPTNKKDYKQKLDPDNPITYLRDLGVNTIWRFIVTHPDMDHLDGIQDLYKNFAITNTWDTNNNKECDLNEHFGGYNKEDWKFYKKLRNNQVPNTKRLTLFSGEKANFWQEDNIEILSPTPSIVTNCNNCGDYNDLSYVFLFTPPKINGRTWKILFAGDSDDLTWEHILNEHSEKIKNVDILLAPHHGRDSGRDYKFLETITPTITLFGNAASKHLAYDKYPEIRITNNQAGYVIIDCQSSYLGLYVKNKEFAHDFCTKRGFQTTYSSKFKAYMIGQINAK